MSLDPRIRRVLELAERCTSVADVPAELKVAERWCIAKRMVWMLRRSPPGEPPGPLTPVWRVIGDASGLYLLLRPEGEAALAEDRLGEGRTAEESDDKDWILATEALKALPFIRGGVKALYKYAADNPTKLRVRPHPHHKRRRQAHAADVQRLSAVHDAEQSEALDGRAADDLPSLSEDGLGRLADRMTGARAAKRK
jgi:hypothetical protein